MSDVANDPFLETYGPWAIVTGASYGVGAAWADAIAAKGLGVVMVARKEALLEDKASILRARGAEVRTLAVDVLATDAIDRLRECTADLEVGLVVQNVGGVKRDHGLFLDDSLEAIEGVIAINALVTARLVYEYAPAMRARGRGGLVVVGSLSGMAGQPTEAAYSAAKAFEQVFCEAMWCELRGDGVHVVSVPLGGTRTPGLASAQLGIDPETIPTAEEVVAEAIEHIADGPVFVPVEANRRFFDKITRLPRREAAEAMERLAMRVARAN